MHFWQCRGNLKLEHIPYVPGSTLDIITPSVGTSDGDRYSCEEILLQIGAQRVPLDVRRIRNSTLSCKQMRLLYDGLFFV